MLTFHVKLVQTDGQTERWTIVKQYAPDLSMRGIKREICQNVLSIANVRITNIYTITLYLIT